MTRKAGLLLNKRRGRQINYGLVLEDLINTKGETVLRQNTSTSKSIKVAEINTSGSASPSPSPSKKH